ncbi:MAG TPA: hypothetical protein VFS59_10195 [Gemmatimonadaceae bacterium]|nr:hypothetical protein [Gemmatimonadaceae bacterium]
MVSHTTATRTALVVAGAMAALAATSTADAQQRRDPRIAVAAPPRVERPQTDPRRAPTWYGTGDPRGRPGRWEDDRSRGRRSSAPTVIYVVPGGYGYGYGAGYYGSVYGGVTDANGRPLYSGYESAPSGGGYGYTPDLTGAPYAVSDEGMMVVDFPSGTRRAFPSCAEASSQRDPQGRPRTIFYQAPDYWMVLRPGQRGRVHGEPPTGAAACYAIDSVGKVVLRY